MIILPNRLFYVPGCGSSVSHAAALLRQHGFSFIDHPSPEITHLLLDVPSFSDNCTLKNGMRIERILEVLPETITVIGGNLSCNALDGYRCLDLLQDPEYVAHNAALTARCAVRVAVSQLPSTLESLPVLVIGWGRIGMQLAFLLQKLGACVSICSRDPQKRAIAAAFGMKPLSPAALADSLPDFRVVFNTAPSLTVDKVHSSRCENCLKIDLASKPGILGEDVISARGLPGRLAPESSGALIAEIIKKRMEEAQ